MSDETIENLNQELSMIRNTTYTLLGSATVRNWIYDQDYFQQGSKEGYLNQEKLKKETQKILIDNNVWSFELFDYVTIYQNDHMLAYAHSKPYSLQKIIENTEEIIESLKHQDNYAMMLPPSETDQTIYTTLRIQSDFKKDDSLYVIGATREEYFNKRICNAIAYEGTIVYIADKYGII
jgi:two-component system sensor histidine kinase YesM